MPDYIRIYPEWNVKLAYQLPEHGFISIRIYPEWNVKFVTSRIVFYFVFIRIYPEWNVKAKQTVRKKREVN